MPDQLSEGDGNIAWAAEFAAWGFTSNETFSPASGDSIPFNCRIPQNLRLQGQYIEREIGLHFNTFRFYDPAIGRFISDDPIGLKGGENLQQYALNPTTWIDPLGLSGERYPNWMNTRQGYQRQHLIPYSLREHPLLVRSGMNINGASNMMYLPVAPGIDPRGEMGLHRGWTQKHLNYNKGMARALDQLEMRAIKEHWDYRQTQRKLLDLQRDRRKGFISGRYTCA